MAAKEKEITIEETFTKLNTLIDEMDTEGISLEESFKKYEEGLGLIKSAAEKIDLVEKKLIELESK